MRSGEHSVTLAADMRSVSAARRFVEHTFGRVVPVEVVSDLVLATSELVTNAIEHGDTPDVVLTAAVEGGRAWISVRSVDDRGRIAPADRWRPAAAQRTSGRGLGIVHALADDVTVARGNGTVEIIVSKRIRD